MPEPMRAIDVRAGDSIETPWNGNVYRVTAVVPSPTGKIVQIHTTVERSNDAEPAVGRVFKFGRQAGTLLRVQRTERS